MRKIRLFLAKLFLPSDCRIYDFEGWRRLTAYHCLHGQLEEILVIRAQMIKPNWYNTLYKYIVHRQAELEDELTAFKSDPININNDEERLG